MVEHVDGSYRGRQAPRLAVYDAGIDERRGEPFGGDLTGPVEHGAIGSRSLGAQNVEAREHVRAELRMRARRAAESTEPHAVAPQEVIERPVDRAEERATLELALDVRQRRTGLVQPLVHPAVVAPHELAVVGCDHAGDPAWQL